MTPDATADSLAFAALGLPDQLLDALTTLGYEEPTPIQAESIPPLLAGRDLLGQAATGTGKTAAFALPVLAHLATHGKGNAPFALVLVPTRELAVQVSEAMHKYGRELGARVLPVYGGQPIVRQLQTLQRGVDIVVATPGRAIDHINRRSLDLSKIQTVVLDEADEMLEMGFAEDIESILSATPDDRQTVLFSATMPPRIAGLARRHLTDAVTIEIKLGSADSSGAPLVKQTAYIVSRAHKAAALGRVLDVEAPTAALVFCRTRIEVDQLTETLNGRGYRAEALHGGMGQEQRDKVMARLRSGTADLILATDVAARGLDVEQLTHVVNFDVPSAPESYVHRIGRVGRAGRAGVAITLAEPREQRLLKNIERVTKQRIPIEKVPTVADLHAKRLDLTRAALRETIIDGDTDRFRSLVENLADEFDVMEVALAAVKLAHEVEGLVPDEQEIPEIAERPVRPAGSNTGSGPAWKARPGENPGRRERTGSSTADGMTKLFFGTGKEDGVRPQDLVGAIAGETSLSGRDIGGIQLSDRFSLVEVPSGAVDEVIDAMRQTTIKGRRVNVRRERFSNDGPRPAKFGASRPPQRKHS